MRLSQDEIDAVIKGEPGAIARIRPVMRKCAKAGAFKAGAPDLADDVEQELWLFMMGSGGTRIDLTYNLEPWLIEAARRMTLALRRNLQPAEEISAEEESTETGSEPVTHDDAMHRAEISLDRQKALHYLMRKCNKIRELTVHFVTEEAVEQPKELVDIGQARREPAKAYRGSPAARELREIRQRLRLTHEEMAMRLGLKMPTYQSYEYARVKAVPEDVMERARALLDDQDYSYAAEIFKGRKMSEIVADWAKRLGLEASVSQIARLLAVNKSTVSRWLTDQAMPNPYELLRYESIVNLQAKRLAAAKSAHLPEPH